MALAENVARQQRVTYHERLARARTLIFILALGTLGWWWGPADLEAGSYTATVSAVVEGSKLEVVYPFEVGREGDSIVSAEAAGEFYRLVVSGVDAYPDRLGTRLTFTVQVVDRIGGAVPLGLGQVTSVIRGEGYEQELPPTEAGDNGVLFGMRLPFRAKIVMAILFLVAGMWLTEAVPLAAAAIFIPVAIVVTGVAEAETVLAPFAHPIIVLFLAGFLMAEAMRRTGVDRLIAISILKRASHRPAFLMLTMMILVAFLAMWMSNTAAVSIVIPIALAVLEKMPEGEGTKNFKRALILGVAYAAASGGIGSAIGSPSNLMALTFLNEYTGAGLTFMDWFKIGLPMVALLLPTVWLWLLFSFGIPLRAAPIDVRRLIDEGEEQSKGLQWQQGWVLATFLVVMALWLSEPWHGVPTGIVALGGAFALFVMSFLKQEDLNRINWNALLTFGGSLAIGTMLVSTGVSDWIALQLIGLATLPAPVVIFLIAGIAVLTSAFISNTASSAMLIPLVIPLAQMLQLDPVLLVAVVAIGSAVDFALVVGTPPTMIAYATGFFTTQDIFRRGIVLDVLGVILLSFVVVWIWLGLGVVGF